MFAFNNHFQSTSTEIQAQINVRLEELETAWLKRLYQDWQDINFQYLNDKLKQPIIRLFDGKTDWGYWIAEKRELGINRQLISQFQWEAVTYVLKHEVAHQMVDELFFETGKSHPHGEAFKKACDYLAIKAESSCHFEDTFKNNDQESKIIQKVHKLFSLAQSDNEFEAKNAMSQANRLLLKHNLTLLNESNLQNYGFCYLGSQVGKVSLELSLISNILNDYFFVEVLWISSFDALKLKKGFRLKLYGTNENLEVASYVYDFLLNQAAHLWQIYRKEKNIKGNRLRKSFQTGLLGGFKDKLDLEKKGNQERGLIWLGDQKLKTFFRRNHPKIVHSSGTMAKLHKEAHEGGVKKGKEMQLAYGIKNSSNSVNFLETK